VRSAGAFFDQLFELFAAALAHAGQAPALVEEQHEEHQGQPRPGSGEAGVALVFEGDLGFAQQVQGPAFGLQRQGFPEVIGVAVRALTRIRSLLSSKRCKGWRPAAAAASCRTGGWP
jgi:hypothetical protein